ncbi:MAG: hypothetical protein HOP34_07245 [Methylococcaceae bacterium]|nr:hypothetical protein [Methylococcaceae bacterium]
MIEQHGTLSKTLVRTQAALALFVLLWLGGLDFFFPSHFSLQAGVHGLSTISAMVAATFLTHRAYHLIRGVHINMRSLRYWALAATVLNFFGAVSGNWVYMRYRGEGGAKDWILAHAPSFHNVMMEFKEFVSLFPFPLMLAVTFVLFYYGDALATRRDLLSFVGLLMLIAWLFLLLGFVSGLTLAKLHFL